MAHLQYSTFNISVASRTVSVPDSPIAKLMYYLDIVCTLVEYDDDNFDRLRNYRNYRNLTDLEIRLLFIVCSAVGPDSLTGKIIFEDELGILPRGSINRIYDLSEIRHQLFVVSSIFIAGRNRSVKKVMIYKPEWIRNYYVQPMLAVAFAIGNERRQEAIANQINECLIS